MSLATTCPQCKTSFKVVPDQLKLRRGLVRCGVCQHVFSGIDYLRYVDDAARAAQRAARERAAVAPSPATGSAPAAAPPTPPPEPAAAPGPDRSGVAARSTGDPSVAHDALASPPDGAAAPRDDAAPAYPGPGGATPPADPWAAAAAIAHERSLHDDDGPPAAPVHPVPAPPDARPSAAAGGARDDAAGGVAPTDGAAGPDGGVRDAAPAVGSSIAPVAPAASGRDAAPPMPARPALPAPGARPVPLDDLLARPAAPWPPAYGPQTVIAADDDLKTAFFLTDSSFGPLPGETSDVMPPTSIHRPGAHAEAVTRVHGEEPPAPSAPSAPSAGSAAAAGPRGGTPALPAPSGAGASPNAPSAPPGLPLRPERGAAAEGSPAFVPVPSPFEPVPFEPTAPEPALQPAAPIPFEPAPRRTGPPSDAAIDYFPGARRRSRGLGLALSPTAWVGAVGLSLLLALQAVVGWRDAIAARVPLVAPTLASLLGPFGLEIRPPRELDALTIEGFELQASGTPNVLALSAVLRNRSGHVVGYPAMELTLTDSAGALIVRKVIPPVLYVGDPATIEAGLAARSERPLRLSLRHDGLQPTGFAVALFYP